MLISGRMLLLLMVVILPRAGFSEIPAFDARPVFKIGFHISSFPDLTPMECNQTLDLLAKELGKFAQLKVFNTSYEDIKKMRDDFQQGVFNFVILPPLTIIKYYDTDMLRGGFNATANNQILDTLQLITRKNEGIDDFRVLQGKRISLLENDSLSTLYLGTLVSQLSRKGMADYFYDIDKQKKSQRLIFKLFFKQTDAILIYKSQLQLAIEMNPQIGKTIQVLEQFKSTPRGIGFFHKDVSEKSREYIISQVLRFQKTVRGKQLLEVLKSDQIKRSHLSDLQGISDLYISNRQLGNSQ